MKTVKKIPVFLILLLFLFSCVNKNTIKKENLTNKYIGSNGELVKLFNQNFEEIDTIPRGEKVVSYNKIIKNESEELFEKIKYKEKAYLVSKKNIVPKLKEVVFETKMFVRTPVTVYKEESSKILTTIKKGEELAIIGFDKITDLGVNKYKIKYRDQEGYVYAKYLVDSKELSLKHYDEEKTYLYHKNKGNTLGGGSGANLDYYPNVKPSFENNKMPKEVRSLYLNTTAIKNVEEYIKLAKKSNINAFVVDIKDDSRPGYDSPVMKEYSITNYNRAINKIEDYKKSIKKLKDAGFYVIGRITVFKDTYFVKDNPDSAITLKNTNEPLYHNNSYWPSAYDRLVWEFNVLLAKEAITEMDFNEIQFDYVRFPDRVKPLEDSNKIDMKNKYKEEKAQAIQQFLMYATDEIHTLNVYVAADVFGESAHHYITAYGQYWPAISNVVDVISPMPYPDHFNPNEYGFKEIVWTVPYKLLKFWAQNYVVVRQNEIPTPAIVRSWIQTYDAIRPPYIKYNNELIYDQIKAFYDIGLTGGFMTWNSGSSLAKYKEVTKASLKLGEI